MSHKQTPHIKPNGVEIAETILLPGDPLRAKFIAETFLEDAVCFNEIRGMLGYTGTYKGKKISVMGTGMGPGSIGIYSYELIHFFGVKNLIRIGTCGSLQEHVKVYDVILGMASSTNTNYMHQYKIPGTLSLPASYELLSKAYNIANEKDVNVHVGNILCSDIFYNADKDAMKNWMKMGVLGVEMESTALYANAIAAGVNALTILTVSDSLVTGEETSPEERQTAFTKMMEIALELA
ncbi:MULTISPECIES: purine-nucleoside phosphorylase [unclassified Gemella]|uniref:purine-nucleoside phosphorylase n=1 Tax=unclassified Gemella TaxID=2624949 RepID=UPI0010742199|nr:MULTISPECIES: purine-nucleoside phosphorylase [unclassified Gemella]MBF0709659.1 purine-nucleoside phosphorylase [Gemella sp. GL1.1]MBF0746922.1 purine-nucleoside phosphorylase [Gemella sp. 19428wG2_WT2a]NYS27003.1 purine-nucleoside phosphorylase [Gemella sp. GL1]TFU59148.1 purine-nucleoside phosphorylase [Gemella sp. WT2a]